MTGLDFEQFQKRWIPKQSSSLCTVSQKSHRTTTPCCIHWDCCV